MPKYGRCIRKTELKSKNALLGGFIRYIRRQEVADAAMKQGSRKRFIAVEHLEDLRWKKKQRKVSKGGEEN